MPAKKKPFQSPEQRDLDAMVREPRRQFGLLDTPVPIPSLGAEAVTVACAMCGNENPQDAQTCTLCGGKTEGYEKPAVVDQPRRCSKCSFSNDSTATDCQLCRCTLEASWKCIRCQADVANIAMHCTKCNMPRLANTLKGRSVEVANEVNARIPIECDWPLFPEALQWIKGSDNVAIDTSGVITPIDTTVDLPGEEEGETWPYKTIDENYTTLKVGDTVSTHQFDRRMSRQRCGWSTHMILFCGQEAVVKRILANEDRAQLLLKFKNVDVDDTHDRKVVGWFDYEWVKCQEGTKLPSPPGGWYEKLQRFPLKHGDTVRVRQYNSEMENMKCGWDARMQDLAGRSAVILRVLVTARFAQVHLEFTSRHPQPRITSWWDIEWLDLSPSVCSKTYNTCSTGLCSGAVAVSASNVRKCPHGHDCRWVVNPYKDRGGSVECEGCHKSGISDEEVLHCIACDFDLCSKCASGTRVLERTEGAIKSLSTMVRVGDIPTAWLSPITLRLQQMFGRVAMRRCNLRDGRPAVMVCIMGDPAGVVPLLEGQLFFKIHEGSRTVGGTLVTNPISKVDPAILRAIELAFRCHVISLPEGSEGTVMILGPSEERIKAAGKLVWYSSSRKVMIRVDPAERGVIHSKAVEIREKAKCHVSLEHGVAVKLIGLPNAVKATKAAIRQLLETHRHEVQKTRVDKAMSLVASELCEVRLAVPIASALRSVLSQLHEPNVSNSASKQANVKNASQHTERTQLIRRRVQEELNEIHKVAKMELSRIDIDVVELAVPANVAGVHAFHVGDLVVRGPDWEWGDQDGGFGQVGKVIDLPVRTEIDEGGLVNGTIAVEWPNRTRYVYSVGREQHCVHASQQGDSMDEGNDEDSLQSRVVRHKQAYLHLINSIGTQEFQHAQLMHSYEEIKQSKVFGKSDMLQQHLHQTTRDKARVEYGAAAIGSSIDKEEEKSRATSMKMSSAKSHIPEAQLQQIHDLMQQHLENLRSLRAKAHRQADAISMHLISRSAKIRRVLADEIKKERFSGWDIILSIMQATGALIEYKAGDDKLVLTGGEAAVHAAKQKLRDLTVRDLYAWSRVSCSIVVSGAGYTQLAKLQGLLIRIVEQVSGAESVQLTPPNRVTVEGTRPQILKAVEVLHSRLNEEVTLKWNGSRKDSDAGSLVVDEVTVALDSECEVCCTDLSSSNTLSMLCGHTTTCIECLKQWADSKVAERSPASCPSKDCRHVLTACEYRELIELTGGSGNNNYEYIMAMEKLRPTVRQCYNCPEGFAVRSEEGDMVPIMCADCKALICPNSSCSEPAHYFLDCNEVIEKRKDMLLRRKQRLKQSPKQLQEVNRHIARLEETSQTQEVLKQEMDTAGETRPCPSCGALVHKTGGCNSMTCKCGKKFCHQCLQSNCELVEVSGAKVPCDPSRLKERVDAVLASHKGNSLAAGWLCCDLCDKYPISDMKVYACANCVNWYVCEECEGSGKADEVHDKSHLIVEITQSTDVEQGKVESVPGPVYKIDWEGILPPPCDMPADNLEPEPREAGSERREPRTSISIEPITPVSATLELPNEGDGFDIRMLEGDEEVRDDDVDAFIHAVAQHMHLPNQAIQMDQ